MDRLAYWDSFDCQVQCEELGVNVAWYDQMMDTIEKMSTEDVLDKCEIVSLEQVHASELSYRMEEGIIEAEHYDWFWDSSQMRENLERQFRLHPIYS